MSAYIVLVGDVVYGPFKDEAAAGQWVEAMDVAGVDLRGHVYPVMSPRVALSDAKRAAGQTEPPVTRQATVCLVCGGVGKCKGQVSHNREWMKGDKLFMSKTRYEYVPFKEALSKKIAESNAKGQRFPSVGRIG